MVIRSLKKDYGTPLLIGQETQMRYLNLILTIFLEFLIKMFFMRQKKYVISQKNIVLIMEAVYLNKKDILNFTNSPNNLS